LIELPDKQNAGEYSGMKRWKRNQEGRCGGQKGGGGNVHDSTGPVFALTGREVIRGMVITREVETVRNMTGGGGGIKERSMLKSEKTSN